MLGYCDKMIYALILCCAFFITVNSDFGSSCSSPNQCGSNYACLAGKCRCSLGLFRNNTSGECVQNCDDYGTDYTRIPNMYPETGTLIDYQQVQTACECIAMCNSNEHCIAVDYDTSLPWCGIFYNINGADWMDYSTSTTFVRNCAAPTTTGCLPGQYFKQCHSTDIGIGPGCLACPAGTTSDQNNASVCTPCLPGTYSDTTGSSACSSCAAGMQSNNNMTGCDPCLNNTVSVEGGICTECSPGYQANLNNTECKEIQRLTFTSSAQTGNKNSNSKAKKAIDNDNSTCARTAERKTPNWRGQLSNTAVVKEVVIMGLGTGGNVVATVYIEMSETDRSHPCNHYAGPSTDHTFTCPQNLVGQYVIVERYPLNNKKRILRNCEVIAHGYYLD